MRGSNILLEYPFNMTSARRGLPPDLASLSNPETGRLEAVMPADHLWVAGNAEIEGTDLHFHWRSARHLRPPSSLLERFLGLRSDEGILRFAEKFGPMDPRGLHLSEYQEIKARPGGHAEALTYWRHVQQESLAMLSLIAAVRERQSPKKETFADLYERGMLPLVSSLTLAKPGKLPPILGNWETCSLKDRLSTARSVFQEKVRTFVRHCGLKPALAVESKRGGFRMELVFQDARADFRGSGLSLFGVLTVQLMSAATGSALAICSACGNFFVPKRRQPAFGKRRYCGACGRAAALRDAKADYRERQRNKSSSASQQKRFGQQRAKRGKK